RAAPISRTEWATSARPSTSLRLMSSSWCTFSTPASDITRWVSMSGWSFNTCSRRTPYTAPVAPVMAMIRRLTAGMKALLLQQFVQFTAGVHFRHDVGAADEFAIDVELRNRGPVGI